MLVDAQMMYKSIDALPTVDGYVEVHTILLNIANQSLSQMYFATSDNINLQLNDEAAVILLYEMIIKQENIVMVSLGTGDMPLT